MNPIDRAVDTFSEGKNCAQAIVSAFGPSFGLEKDKAMAVSLAFGGGMGCTGRTCGAVTGAMMVLGLHCAAMAGSETDHKQRANAMARNLLTRFEAIHGVGECRVLLGVDISTPSGMKQAAGGLFKSRCPQFVRDAATILAEMVKENTDDRAS